MPIRTLINGGLISAVIFFSLLSSWPICGQSRKLDQRLSPLARILSSDSLFKKQILESADRISGVDIRKHIAVLASDSFEGRATGSDGFEKAANYVSRHFEQNGVVPAGSSYYQTFKIETKTVRSKVHLEHASEDSVETMNVVGIKKGTINPDEYVVITAHLDHLGKKQDSIYHGANDNASGVAVMMAVAAALKDIPTKRSVIFIAFTGEEVGLMGSAYFVTHPPIDLKKIRFMINLDLVGSGTNGIMVQGVNGHEEMFSEIQMVNQKYFQFELGTRPNSPNSDQYYFHLLGVPAFFMYAYNGTMPYHSPGDTADKIDAFVVENVAKFVLMNVWRFAQNGE